MTTISRRDFLGSSALLVTLAAVRPARAWHVPAAATAERYFTWISPADHVHVAMGEGGNSLVLLDAAKKQALLIDTKTTGFGSVLRREAESLGAPLRLVINSHHHYDHTGGNSAFTADIPVLAHAKALERCVADAQFTMYRNGIPAAHKSLRTNEKPVAKSALTDVESMMKTFPAKEAFKPTREFKPSSAAAPQTETIDFAGEKVEITHVNPGHTDTDLIVRLPAKNVVHTGDLLFNKVWPYVDAPGGFTSDGWIRSLNAIVEMCDAKTTVVPGHGELTDREGVKRQIAFFNDVRDRARAAVKAGTPRDEFTKLTPDEYKDFAAADWIRPITLGGLYDEAKSAK